MDTAVAHDETLAEVLGARARRTPFDRLVLDLVGGALVCAAAVWARPAGWLVLAAAAVCLASYGCWAMLERRRAASPAPEPEQPQRLARAAQAFAGVFGIAAFVLLLFAVLGIALGPIKS